MECCKEFGDPVLNMRKPLYPREREASSSQITVRAFFLRMQAQLKVPKLKVCVDPITGLLL